MESLGRMISYLGSDNTADEKDFMLHSNIRLPVTQTEIQVLDRDTKVDPEIWTGG